MARTHMRWQFGAWDKADHAQVSKDARHLYMVVCSDDTLNQAGIVARRARAWATEAAMSEAEAEAAFDELVSRRFLVADPQRDLVLIRTFIRNDGVHKQPNVLRSALSHARNQRSVPIRQALAAELRRLPQAAPDKTMPNGKTFTFPDPHAVADIIDPALGERAEAAVAEEITTPSSVPSQASRIAERIAAGPAPTAPRAPNQSASATAQPSPNPSVNPSPNIAGQDGNRPVREPFAEPPVEVVGVGEGVSPSEQNKFLEEQYAGARTHARTHAGAREATPADEVHEAEIVDEPIKTSTKPGPRAAKLVGEALPRQIGGPSAREQLVTSIALRLKADASIPDAVILAALSRWVGSEVSSPRAIDFMLDDEIKRSMGLVRPQEARRSPWAKRTPTERAMATLRLGMDDPSSSLPALFAKVG